MQFTIKHDAGEATITASGDTLHFLADSDGRSVFGFDPQEDGTVVVGHWNANGEWVRGFVVGEPKTDDNWVAQ